MEKLNEFRVSSLRNFGSENITFTATINSDNLVLADEELQSLIDQNDAVIKKAFQAVCDREISEKILLTEQSSKREKANNDLNAQLKNEVSSAENMNKTGSKLSKIADK